MQYASYALPPAYVFESMRTILAGAPALPSGLVWAASLAVLYILPACWFFARIHRHTIRTGLLARYSAETLSCPGQKTLGPREHSPATGARIRTHIKTAAHECEMWIPLKKSYWGHVYPHFRPRNRWCLGRFWGFFSGIQISQLLAIRIIQLTSHMSPVDPHEEGVRLWT